MGDRYKSINNCVFWVFGEDERVNRREKILEEVVI